MLVDGTETDNDLKYYVSSKMDTINDLSQSILENQHGADLNVNVIDLEGWRSDNAIKTLLGMR